jgi:tRNA pseudouridine55 synthase
MTEPDDDFSGVLLVDKPPAWTSHDVVSFIRRFGFRKVGHCGTLDPAATGLLVIVIGRATRQADRFAGQDKVYDAVLRLGVETASQDADGEVTARRDWQGVTSEQVRAAMAAFVGPQLQIPPMVSAIKQDGRRLYELARRGLTVERPPRPITVHALDILRLELPEVAFRVACSKGTYVRTLSADIGTRLGCGAHLQSLRRCASGRFRVEDAFPLDQIRTWDLATVCAKAIALDAAVSRL